MSAHCNTTPRNLLLSLSCVVGRALPVKPPAAHMLSRSMHLCASVYPVHARVPLAQLPPCTTGMQLFSPALTTTSSLKRDSLTQAITQPFHLSSGKRNYHWIHHLLSSSMSVGLCAVGTCLEGCEISGVSTFHSTLSLLAACHKACVLLAHGTCPSAYILSFLLGSDMKVGIQGGGLLHLDFSPEI